MPSNDPKINQMLAEAIDNAKPDNSSEARQKRERRERATLLYLSELREQQFQYQTEHRDERYKG